jgi:hypothetical protein
MFHIESVGVWDNGIGYEACCKGGVEIVSIKIADGRHNITKFGSVISEDDITEPNMERSEDYCS